MNLEKVFPHRGPAELSVCMYIPNGESLRARFCALRKLRLGKRTRRCVPSCKWKTNLIYLPLSNVTN